MQMICLRVWRYYFLKTFLVIERNQIFTEEEEMKQKQKHIVKAILSVVMTIAMVFGTVQLPFAPGIEVVHAEPTLVVSGTCGASTNDGEESSVTWTLYSDGKLTISGMGAMADFSYNSLSPWFDNRSSITSVEIVDGVTSIGDWAFTLCTSLKEISIPNSVTRIGKWAIRDCESLDTITIPSSVTNIGKSAFNSCTSLKEISIPNSVTSIEEDAFNGCRSLETITIPSSVTNIGEYAFNSCTSLKEISIPNSVTSIGDCAFKGCGGLKKIIIPNSVTSIGKSAFNYCTSLKEISIPNSVTSIGKSAFKECYGLETIIMPDGEINIDETTFSGCDSLKTVYAPEYLTIPNVSVEKIKRYTGFSLNESGNSIPAGLVMLKGETANNVIIPEESTAILSNVTITGGIECAGNATIILAGENTVTALDNHAGIYVPEDNTITINGNGKLKATGGQGSAGIGAKYCGDCGNIVIERGMIEAIGNGTAAGIGGAECASFGNIEISGGNVTARGGRYSAAGIGGSGHLGVQGGDITITGGEIHATGGSGAAGIGCGGDGGNCGNILISGGVIDVKGGDGAVGIGSVDTYYYNSKCYSITITDGVTSLTATGGENAVYSIGKGTDDNGHESSCGEISIGGVKVDPITTNPFTTKPLQMTFVADGGTGEMDAKKVMQNLAYELPTCDFIAPVGMTFKEWSVKVGNGDAVTKSAGATVKITDNTEVTAVWKDRISTDIPSAIGNLTYDGTEKTGVIAGIGYILTDNTAINAGSYSAKAVLDAEYKWSDDTIADREISWSIAPKTVTSPTIEIAEASYVYTGAEIKPAVTVKDGETTIPASEYAVSYKDNINAGTATITITDNKDGNYTVSGSKTFTINKATPTYEVPTGLTATTGQTLANVTLPTGWAWADKTLSVGNVGNNVFKATYTPTDTTNYNVVENIELIVTVSKAAATNTSGGNTSSGGSSSGGSSSGGGSGSSGSDNTADKDKTTTTAPVTEKKTNADGSITETTKTTNADGSKTETEKTTSADGTVSETKKTTAKDGSVTETGLTTTADGVVTQTEKTTSVDGTVKETEKTSDATGTVTEKSYVTQKDGSAVVTETVTEKDGSSSSTTVTVGSDGKAKTITATESNSKSDTQTISFEVKGNKVSVSAVESTTGIAAIPSEITAPDGKTYKVTKIEKNAFDGKKIKELNLSDSVKVIAPKALVGTDLKKLNLKGENTKLKKNCLKDTNKNLVITVKTKLEKKKIERQLKKAGNPTAKVKVSKKK